MFTRFATSGQQRGWRKYADAFKDSPSSHLVSFGILHELTAILPLPLIFYTLQTYNLSIPFPEEFGAYIVEGNVRMRRLVKYFGFDLDLSDNSRVMCDLASTYAIVKILMPIRVGLSIMLAPGFARIVVQPVMRVFKAAYASARRV